MRRWFAGIVLLLGSLPMFAQGTAAIQGHSYLGGTQAQVSGLSSTNYLNGIIPHATITVYLTGTQTLATIYKDASKTPLSNPFTSNDAGSVNPGGYIFWAAVNQGYDIVMSGGTCPNCYASPVTLEDVFPSMSFSSTCTSGCVAIDPTSSQNITQPGGTSLTLNNVNFCLQDGTNCRPWQHNGVNLTIQFKLNFSDTTPVAPSGSSQVLFQSDGSGNLSAYTIANVSGGFQNYTPDPLGTQSVLVPFTVATNNLDGGPPCFASSNTTSGQVGFTGGGSNLGCEAPPGPSITWSAAQLPAYVTPANVTAIYAVGTVGYVGNSQALNLKCSNPTPNTTVLMNGGTIGGTDTGVLKAYSAQLTWATGANIGTISCVANVAANAGGANNPAMKIDNIQLRVYYTGTAPPASDLLNLTAPLYINPALNSMGVAAINLAGSGDGGVIGLLPASNLAPPVQTALTGTTAGTAVWSQPQQFSTWKQAVVYLNGYENTTATAQTITLPASFATVSYVITDGGSCAGVTIGGATVTLPASMGATQTGLCEIRGY